MPITALDARTALVVIDMQRGVVALQTAHPMPGVVDRCALLARAFRDAGKVVVLVNVKIRPGIDALKPRADVQPPARTITPDFFELIPELGADHERDVLVTKRQWGAFYGTDLDLQLRRRGITGIVMCGVATSIGVESTARDAYERGYNLSFASDAMTDMSAESHENSLKRIFPRMGEVGRTDEVVALLK